MEIEYRTVSQRGLGGADLGSSFVTPKRRFIPSTDLQKTVQTLLRSKWAVVGSIFAALLLAVSLIAFATPLYTASVDLILESPSQPVVDVTNPANNELRNEADLFNEIVAIQSRGLAGRVIDKLNLSEDAEFNAKLQPKGPFASFLDNLLTSKTRKIDDKANIIDRFLRRLHVQNVPRSRALEISFTSADPQKAATTADAIADAYVEAKLDSRFESVKRASAWLADRVQNLRQQLAQSEKAIEDYRSKHNLYEDDGSTLIARQISDLNLKLLDARLDLISAEANYAEARRLLDSPESMGTTAVQVLQSDTIRRFREQELELDRKAAEMSEQYGARHPAMIQVQAQRQEFRSKIRQEIERITKSLDNQVHIAQSRQASLMKDLDALTTKEAKLNQASLGLRVIERNAEANRLILQKMMMSSIEASAQNDIASQVAGARVVSPAAVPDRPSFPRPSVLLPVALLAGAVIGVMLAFALDKLRTGFRSAEQTELATGLPVLAHVPDVVALRRKTISEYLQKRPASAFSEAIRALYMRLMLMKKQSALGVLLAISAQPKEGKTAICASLARQHAQLGQRVVLVDGDFRRSSLAKSIGVKSSPGLSELLVGTAELRDVLQRDPRSGADVIVAGQHWVDSGLLVSDRLNVILTQLKTSYDLIIIDSAAISAISDALVFSHLSDIIIMAVRWGRTPQGLVCSVLNQIATTGRQVDGIVLSRVRVSELEKHEYGSYKRSAKYYTNASPPAAVDAHA